MEFTEQKDIAKSAGELSQAIGEIAAAVSEEDLFESFSVESKNNKIQDQLEKGKCLFAPERFKIKAAAAERVFELLIEKFRIHLGEKTEDWEKIDQGCQAGDIGASELLDATLRHRWDVLQNWAQKYSIDIDALQFFSIYLARPFREQAAVRLWDEDYNSFWRRGYCPVCGHSPVLSRLAGEPQRRLLWCCCCNTKWDFTRIGCAYCSNQTQDQLGYLTVKEFADYRIYFCNQCKRYLKAKICPEEVITDDWDYDREYFSAITLDSIALREGYIAEPVWLARSVPPSKAI